MIETCDECGGELFEDEEEVDGNFTCEDCGLEYDVEDLL